MKRFVLLCAVLLFSANDVTAQTERELWHFDSPDKIGYQSILPSGDLFVSTETSTMRLSGTDGTPKWRRSDLVACQKTTEPGGFLKVRLGNQPFATCQIDGKWERMTFWGPYLRLESGIPDGTPGPIIFQRCRFLQSCIEAGSLAGAPKAMGSFRSSTHDDDDERLVLVNLDTGEDVFDSYLAGLKAVNGTCLLSRDTTLVAWEERENAPAFAVGFDLATGKTLWSGELPLSKEIECVPLGIGDVWLAYGKPVRGNRRVFGLDSSGKTRWESAELAKDEWGQSPVGIADTETSAVLHVDESGPVRISLETGKILWRGNVFRGENPAGDGRGRNPRPQPLIPYRDRILIAQKSKLAALDRDTGKVAWLADFGGPVVVLLETRHGLLVREYDSRGDSTLHLLQDDSGKRIWAEEIASRQTGWLLLDETFFYIRNRRLLALALDSGSTRELGMVSFVDDQSPADIEQLGNNALLVVSGQSAAVFERDGTKRYESSYQAPGLSFGDKLLRMAVANALSTASMYAARATAQNAANTAAYLRGGSATVFYNYTLYTPNLRAPTRSPSTAERFLYLYSEQAGDAQGKEFHLVQLDKESGKETGRLKLKERNPTYVVSPNSSSLFLKTSEQQITAFQLGASPQ